MPKARPSPARQLGAGAVFLGAVTMAGTVGALSSITAADSLELNLPSWSPPSYLFGPIWLVLYLMIALSGWLVWRDVEDSATPITAYCVQLSLNAAWTPVFYGARLYGLAFLEVVLLFFAITATGWLFWRVHRPAALLLLPYWLYTAFACALNFAIWRMNPGL
ncbi:tryptophan-rich sensory protein [Crossiella equi]|uniref:Tryptophan-rich sensory protein n=1 Tax=Crossiella equi TaxID=130796 RepID=A0ABS5AP95_9PSEU|nr:TspO/MBR family protein [Crossiella equi]MBP2478395.1 tryptophan-rich sensory protein [Crossiella equi]